MVNYNQVVSIYSPNGIVKAGALEKNNTRYLIIVYSKLTKIPLALTVHGNTSPRIIRARPEYMNKVTSGETTVVAIIPIGEKVPNSFSVIGAVKIWALVEAPKEAER